MKRLLSIPLLLASLCSFAWGPGDSGGGEPPGPNTTFAEGSQPQCLMPGDFWGELMPQLACGYVPPAAPPTEWTPNPTPPIFVPPPPIPEPSAWAMLLAGLAVVALRARK